MFIELDGKCFGVFECFALGGLGVVATEVVVAHPVEAGGGNLVDNKSCWIPTDGGDGLFYGIETTFCFFCSGQGEEICLDLSIFRT